MNIPIEIWVNDIFPRCEVRVLYQVNKEWNSFIKSQNLQQLLTEFCKPGESFMDFRMKNGHFFTTAQGYYYVGKRGGLSSYFQSRLILSNNELRYAKIWFMRGAIAQNDMRTIKTLSDMNSLAPFFVFDSLSCLNYSLFDYFKSFSRSLSDEYISQIKRTETEKIIKTLTCKEYGAPCCIHYFCHCEKLNLEPNCTKFRNQKISKAESNILLFSLAQRKQWDEFIHIAKKLRAQHLWQILPLIDAQTCSTNLIVYLSSFSYLRPKLISKGCQLVYQGRKDVLELIIPNFMKDEKGILQRFLFLTKHYNFHRLFEIFSKFVVPSPNITHVGLTVNLLDLYCTELIEQEQELLFLQKPVIINFDSVDYFKRIAKNFAVNHHIAKLLIKQSFKIISYSIEENLVDPSLVLDHLKQFDYPEFLHKLLKKYPEHLEKLVPSEWLPKSQLLLNFFKE